MKEWKKVAGKLIENINRLLVGGLDGIFSYFLFPMICEMAQSDIKKLFGRIQMCHNSSRQHAVAAATIHRGRIEKLFGFLMAPKCAILLFVNGLAIPDNLFGSSQIKVLALSLRLALSVSVVLPTLS
jgi:hypothetical protein